ncbi:MAG: polymer-forming cytoskeletal protein [bacterium]|nr:polymer-forming cytoskeletal protein [bacterium]
MFGRQTQKIETLIGKEVVLQGILKAKGTLRIDGKIEGNIVADTIIIGEGAEVTGDINCESIIIGGKVIGNITSIGSIELLKTGQLIGDIKTPQLTIAQGSIFEGNCVMTQAKEGKIIELEKKR